MDTERIAIAQSCLAATHDGSLSFPEIIGELVAAGFEGYTVDYRRHAQTFYMPNDDCIDLAMPHAARPVAVGFNAVTVEALVRWAQAGAPDYSYNAFCQQVTAAGCAGYLVSFLGRRVVYYGRTGETHVELMPQ